MGRVVEEVIIESRCLVESGMMNLMNMAPEFFRRTFEKQGENESAPL